MSSSTSYSTSSLSKEKNHEEVKEMTCLASLPYENDICAVGYINGIVRIIELGKN